MPRSGAAQRTEGGVILAAATAALIAAGLQLSAHGGSTLALTLLCLGIVLVVLGLYATLFGITTRPRLRFSDPYTDFRPIGRLPSPAPMGPYHGGTVSSISYTGSYAASATGPMAFQRSAQFAYVDVSNEPRLSDTAANDLRIELTFWDEGGNCLYSHVNGRWAAQDAQPLQPQTGLHAPEITLPANRAREVIDVAFAYTRESRMYVFNDENRVYDPEDLRHRELPDELVYVRVALIGSNTSGEAWFKLSCDPSRGGLSIEPTIARLTDRSLGRP